MINQTINQGDEWKTINFALFIMIIKKKDFM